MHCFQVSPKYVLIKRRNLCPPLELYRGNMVDTTLVSDQTNITDHIDIRYLLIRGTGRAHHLCGVLPPNPKPQSNHKKMPDKTKLRDSLQNIELFKSVKVMKHRGS